MAFASHAAPDMGARRASQRAGLAALAFALLGITLAGFGVARLAGLPWGQAATAFSARSWPVAEARILSARLTEVRAASAAGSEMVLTVDYEFEAQGRTFAGARASLADRSAPQDRRLVSLFRRAEFARLTGRTMPAAYDPAEPSRAFLDAGFPWRDALPGFGLGIALLLLGAQLLARALRR